jgi:hypothetical protein
MPRHRSETYNGDRMIQANQFYNNIPRTTDVQKQKAARVVQEHAGDAELILDILGLKDTTDD